MERFDLTLDRVISTKYGEPTGFFAERTVLDELRYPIKRGFIPDPFEDFNNPLTIFVKEREHKEMQQDCACHTGTGEMIEIKEYCDGFGGNDGSCDACGGFLPPWQSYGVCPECNKRFRDSDSIQWLEDIPKHFFTE